MEKDIYILNLESSTSTSSVSISKNGKTWLLKEKKNANHATDLSIFIEDIFREKWIDKKDLSAIAISGGPGSYTGLRIASAMAKAMAFALDIPLISVNTLELPIAALMRNEQMSSDALILSVLDARRADAFALLKNHENQIVKNTFFATMNQDFVETLIQGKKKLFVCGNATEKLDSLKINFPELRLTAYQEFSARDMEELTFEKWSSKKFEQIDSFEPEYLKAPFITQSKKNLL